MNLEALHPHERLALNLFARGEAHEAGLLSTFFIEPARHRAGGIGMTGVRRQGVRSAGRGTR